MELKSNNWYKCTNSFEFLSNTFTKDRLYYCYKDNLVSDQGKDISIYALSACLTSGFFSLITAPKSDTPIITSVETFKSITAKMISTYESKNHDYGNSFEASLNKFGLTASIIRMGDKMNRIESLSKKESKVSDESIKDTLLDLANYAIMTIMWLNTKEKND